MYCILPNLRRPMLIGAERLSKKYNNDVNIMCVDPPIISLQLRIATYQPSYYKMFIVVMKNCSIFKIIA